jgi:hypothetical protein
MQGFGYSIKITILRIMGVEEREEAQDKRIGDIFKKIMTEKCPNLEKALPIQVHEASRTLKRLSQNRTSPWLIIIKPKTKQSRERIWKAVREEKQIKYKGKPIKITANLPTENIKERRTWSEVYWAQKENNLSPCILYPAKLSFKIDEEINFFHVKQKLKQYMTKKPPLQKILQQILPTEDENKTTRRQEILSCRRRKYK